MKSYKKIILKKKENLKLSSSLQEMIGTEHPPFWQFYEIWCIRIIHWKRPELSRVFFQSLWNFDSSLCMRVKQLQNKASWVRCLSVWPLSSVVVWGSEDIFCICKFCGFPNLSCKFCGFPNLSWMFCGFSFLSCIFCGFSNDWGLQKVLRGRRFDVFVVLVSFHQ